MIDVQIETGKVHVPIYQSDEPLSVGEIWKCVRQNDISRDQFYIMFNGQIVTDDVIIPFGKVILIPKLVGGKSGFGSMLRVIGTQIEKTTYRKVCRDLSSQRMIDINQEKKLRVLTEKRRREEEEFVECKKKKLETHNAEPKHKFNDESYFQYRLTLVKQIENVIEEGFKVVKGKRTESNFKRKTIPDMDFDSNQSELLESDYESPPIKLRRIQ